MLKRKASLLTSTLFLSLTSANVVAESVLRVYCDKFAQGAKIFINGQFKANCSADLFLPPGDTKLRVVQVVDDEYEKVFETDLFLGDGTAQRVNVQLSAAQLTEDAVAKRTALRLQKEKAEAEAALASAKAGDIDAMRAVAELYRAGKGLDKNEKQAVYWSEQATNTENQRYAETILKNAESGDIDAMMTLSGLYEAGKGVDKNAQKAQEWQQKAESLTAEKALISAKSGNVADMRRIASFYSEGVGVQKNDEQAKFWNEKADATLAAEEKRILDEQREAQRISKNENIQRQIDNVSFLEYTEGYITDYFTSLEEESELQAFAITSAPVSSVLPTVLGLVNDLVSAPTKTFDLIHLKTELAARPSKFDNPDSMIAKAYNMRRQGNE